MKCFLRKTLRGFEPADSNAVEIHKRTKLGDIVRADIVKPRNYQHHKLFFALLSLTYDNQTDYTDQKMFRRAVALEAGHCTVTVAFDGTTHLSPLSYSYDDIPDEHEFTAAFARAEAGKRIGIEGERSGLWIEYLRLVQELRPDWVVAENVAALRYRGYDRVASDLAAAGYTCRPFMVAALHVGATQERKRAWIVANANNSRLQRTERKGKQDSPRTQWQAACSEPLRSTCGLWPPGPGAVSNIPRMDDGSADRVHRLKALGNTIVPQIPEIVGRAIMKQFFEQANSKVGG